MAVAVEMAAHPATDLFPMMGDEELGRLAADIRERGLLVPIVTHQGKVLDGRNRLRACQIAGVEPQTEPWTGIGSPTAWVISINLHRRHLTASQRAAIAVDAEALFAREAKERQGTRTDIKEKVPESVGQARDQAAAMFNVNPHYVTDAKKLAAESPDLFESVRQGDQTITEAKRKAKERKRETKRADNRALVEQTTPPERVALGRFETVVLDPPWDWGDEGDADQLGRARPTYATMPIAEIAALPVPDLAANNAHLYLWITNRSLPKGFALLEAWGFRYVTCLTWCKPSFGMGNYFRGQTEQVLFGVRGSQPLLRKDVGTWFAAARGIEHSSKPDAFYALVESCSPGPWLEMFQRRPRPGWVGWGAEVQ